MMKNFFAGILFVAIVHFCQTSSPTEADFERGGYPYAPIQTEVEAALQKAREINLLKRNINLYDRDYKNKSVHRCPLSFHHGIRQQGGDKMSESKTNDALLAVRILMHERGYSTRDLEQESVREIFKRAKDFSCDVPKPGKCDFGSRYRTADGSCNNIKNPDWGMAGNIQQRVLPNDYDDKLGSPRTKGFRNRALPNARSVSNIVHCSPFFKEKLSTKLTLHVMGFGQFLDHDIAITPGQQTVSDCCDPASRDDTDNCFNIIIPKTPRDKSPIFVPGHCMEVSRSAPVFCPDATSFGRAVRQQTNGLTSFIDASNVYGSSAERQEELRENGIGYRLKTTIFGQQERILDNPNNTCRLTNATQRCSFAGDVRINEIPTLTSYHYLFVKEHNRIAEKIKEFFDNKETIFQETRRIIIAIMQKIVYDEFLPSFMSRTGLRKNNLRSSARYVYEPMTNPNLVNAFGIAYRFGHTWVPREIQLFSRSLKRFNQPGFTRNTENVFINPDMTYLPNGLARLSYFLTGRPSPETDSVLEESVRSKLFINTEGSVAFDLGALNIQRGRDHGLPSYNEYRKWCGLSSVRRNWERFGSSGLVDHSWYTRKLLQAAGYSSPLDIDLFAGGLSEERLAGGDLGPTFECIIGRHFRNLKFGDRFWYQNKDARFTRAQIRAIQRYSHSKVLCNNYNFLRVHSPNAFSSRDSLTPCDKIPDLDLSVFKPRTSGDSERSFEEDESSESFDNQNWSWKHRKHDNDKGILTEIEEIENNLGENEDVNTDEDNLGVNEDFNGDEEDLKMDMDAAGFDNEGFNIDVDDSRVDNEDWNMYADYDNVDNEDWNVDGDDASVDNDEDDTIAGNEALNADEYIERMIEELKRNTETRLNE